MVTYVDIILDCDRTPVCWVDQVSSATQLVCGLTCPIFSIPYSVLLHPFPVFIIFYNRSIIWYFTFVFKSYPIIFCWTTLCYLYNIWNYPEEKTLSFLFTALFPTSMLSCLSRLISSCYCSTILSAFSF